MKLLATILFLLLFQFSNAQNIELDYTIGFSYGFNRPIYLEGINPDFTNVSDLSPMFSTTLRWNIKKDKNCLEFIYLKMRESLGARFVQGAGIRKNISGSIDNAFVLSYGQNVKIHEFSILSINLGLGTEIVRGRNRPVNVTIGSLGRYDYQVQNRLQPFLYGALQKDFNWKRHHFRIKLLE